MDLIAYFYSAYSEFVLDVSPKAPKRNECMRHLLTYSKSLMALLRSLDPSSMRMMRNV